MKAVVLCAGRATRLRPLTHTLAKHLIPLVNKPVLFYGLEQMVAAGVREIGIVVNRDVRAAIEAAVGGGERFGAAVTYIEQPQARGLADAARCARLFVGREPFLMHLGDTPIREGFRAMVEVFRAESPRAVVMLGEVSEPHRYGIVQVAGERVVRLTEKPREPESNLAIVGAYVFDSHVFDAIDRLTPSPRGEYEITDAIQDLIHRGDLVRGYRVSGWWQDTGTPADVLRANRVLLDEIGHEIRGEVDGSTSLCGNVVIGRGTKVRNSSIRGPVVIGEDACIENSRVGPYASIGDRVQLHDGAVGDSIIMEGCDIRDVAGGIEESLLGRNVRLRGAIGGARPVHLLLADDSVVE